MGKMHLKHNLPSWSFCIFLFLFAVEPVFALAKMHVIDYIVWSLIMLFGFGTFLLAIFIGLTTQDRVGFILNLTSTSRFSFFDIASALIGLIISYFFNSNLIKLWIFLLVIFIVAILMPNPFKQK